MASWTEKKIYALDSNLCIISEYIDFPDDLESDNYYFAFSLLKDEKIFYFPQFANMIVSFDLKNQKIREEMRMELPCYDDTKTYIVKIYGKEILALMAEDNWLSVLDFSDGILQKNMYCLWDECYNNRVIKMYFLKNGYFNASYENIISGLGLDVFIDVIKKCECDDFNNKQLDQINLIGRKIYEYSFKG